MASFTVAEISGALSRLFDVPPAHPALARYAGQLETFVNGNPELRRSGLSGSGFQTMALTNLPPEVRELMNPAHHQELLRRQAENANVTSATFAAFARAGFAPFGERQSLAGSGEQASSGARYDGISSASLNATQIQTRNYAIQQGVLWAADNPEILKLGSAAIDILKQTQLRKDVFDGLTKEAGLSARGAVGIAKMAKDRGEDANRAGMEIKDSLKAFNDEALKKAVEDRAALELDPKATDEQKKAASKHVDDTVEKAKKRDPANAHHGEKIRERLGTATKANEAVRRLESTETVAARTTSSESESKRAFFGSGPTAAEPSKPGAPASLPRQPAAAPKP